MSPILDKLNSRFAAILEEESVSWKDPNNPEYDRQKAEDALYHTIGPLTDHPVWNETQWSSPGDPVPGFSPGGPAPQWTPEEIIYAMAGDPNLLFRASEHPKSPLYGNKGGAPLWRLAKKVARYYGRDRDRQFIADLYQNGFVPLVEKMQPGFDEGRSPFISFVMRTIQSAMEHGTGGSTSGQMAGGESATFYTDPEGRFRKRRPRDAGEGWQEHQAVGVQGLMKMQDPEEVRQAAQVVQGKYQNTRAYDRDPGNPFGPFSPQYYMLANEYADALEADDSEAIEKAQSKLRQLADEIEDSEVGIRGASTGLGQAISTMDRAKGNTKEIISQLKEMEVGSTADIGRGTVTKLDERTYEVRGIKMSAAQAANELGESGGIGVQSMDVPDTEGGTAAGNVMGDTGEESSIDPEAIKYIYELALNYNLGDLLRNSEKYAEIAISAGAAVDKETGVPKIGGPMTVNELRYSIRTLGPLGSNFYGAGRPREKTEIPRDGRGWWQVGEDPEIEPLPQGDGLWKSAWMRDGFQPMGPTAIANEMTEEVYEFQKLGIESARWPKVKSSGTAVSKVAVNRQTKDARIKLVLIGEIHRHQLGMDIDESVRRSMPILEDVEHMDAMDRRLVVTTCEAIVHKIDRQLFIEDAPTGFRPSIRTMLQEPEDIKVEGMKPVSAIES